MIGEVDYAPLEVQVVLAGELRVLAPSVPRARGGTIESEELRLIRGCWQSWWLALKVRTIITPRSSGLDGENGGRRPLFVDARAHAAAWRLARLFMIPAISFRRPSGVLQVGAVTGITLTSRW